MVQQSALRKQLPVPDGRDLDVVRRRLRGLLLERVEHVHRFDESSNDDNPLFTLCVDADLDCPSPHGSEGLPVEWLLPSLKPAQLASGRSASEVVEVAKIVKG